MPEATQLERGDVGICFWAILLGAREGWGGGSLHIPVSRGCGLGGSRVS